MPKGSTSESRSGQKLLSPSKTRRKSERQKARLEKARLEKARLEKARLEKARLEKEQLERETEEERETKRRLLFEEKSVGEMSDAGIGINPEKLFGHGFKDTHEDWPRFRQWVEDFMGAKGLGAFFDVSSEYDGQGKKKLVNAIDMTEAKIASKSKQLLPLLGMLLGTTSARIQIIGASDIQDAWWRLVRHYDEVSGDEMRLLSIQFAQFKMSLQDDHEVKMQELIKLFAKINRAKAKSLSEYELMVQIRHAIPDETFNSFIRGKMEMPGGSFTLPELLKEVHMWSVGLKLREAEEKVSALNANAGRGGYRRRDDGNFRGGARSDFGDRGEAGSRNDGFSGRRGAGGAGARKFPFRCYNCGKPGHIARNCTTEFPDDGRKPHHANATTVAEAPVKNEEKQVKQVKFDNKSSTSHYSDSSSSSSETFEKCGLSKEEWSLSCGLNKMKKELRFVVDSGASCHMTCDLSILFNVSHSDDVRVQLPDKTFAVSTMYGEARLLVRSSDGRESILHLKNVLYVPDLKVNLFSVPVSQLDGLSTLFSAGGGCVIKNESKNEILYKCNRHWRLYVLNVVDACAVESGTGTGTGTDSADANSVTDESANALKPIKSVDVTTLHKRFGHASIEKIKAMIANGVVSGIENVHGDMSYVCEVCATSKTGSGAHTKTATPATKPLQRVCTDIVQLTATPSLQKFTWQITFVD